MNLASLLKAHSPQTQAIAGLFGNLVVLFLLVFLTVAGLITYAVLRYRARRESSEPQPDFGSKKLETIWTIIPLIVVTILFVVTVRTMLAVDAPRTPDRQPDLIVVGHRWWWEARYPDGATTANEIHIPVGRQLLVQIDSADVIHDFWVPELARKMDAVPGVSGYIWLEADEPGIYQGTCAEFCGVQHAWMRFSVIAESNSDFEVWLKNQSGAPQVTSGANVFQQKGCGNCHTILGTDAAGKNGPDLTHLMSRRTLGGGVSDNTTENLSLWINKPQSAKPGNLMPDSHLTAQESQAMLSYLGTLK